MSERLVIPLNVSSAKLAQLQQLQYVFAEACNTLAPMAREHACFNRVALHHLSYRALREQYPELGSQMVCNVIYSVSRVCRILFQNPKSPFNLSKSQRKNLPYLRFAPTAPVYVDRHTLNIKEGIASMFTLDGRIRFQLSFLFSAMTEQNMDTIQTVLPEYVVVLQDEAAATPAVLLG